MAIDKYFDRTETLTNQKGAVMEFAYAVIGFLISYFLLWICVGMQMYTISKINTVNRNQMTCINLMQQEIEALIAKQNHIIEGCTTIDEFCKGVNEILNDPREWDAMIQNLNERRLAMAVESTGRPH